MLQLWRARQLQRAWDVLVLALAAIIVIYFSWIGFIASDDWLYLIASENWSVDELYVPLWHHAFRYTVTFPLAVLTRGFGESELVLASASILYWLSLAGLTYWVVLTCFGRLAALICTGLYLSTPIFALSATIVNADIPEAFLCLLSIALFHRAVDRNGSRTLVFAAGVVAGVALLNRETAIILVVLYTCLFLGGKYLPRSSYIILILGALAVVAVEMVYFSLIGLSPMHRLHFSIGSHLVGASGAIIEGTGNVTDHWLVGPIVTLAVNHEFGLLFYLVVPAAGLLVRRQEMTPSQRRLIVLLGVLSLLQMLIIGYAGVTRSLPRYFTTVSVAALVVTGVFLARLAERGERRKAAAIGAVLVLTNLLCIHLDNRNFLFGERVLVNLVLDQEGQTIYTDPYTRFRAERLLKWEGQSLERVNDERPPEGAIYLYYPKGAHRGVVRGTRFDTALYLPPEEWVELATFREKRLFLAQIVWLVRARDWLPEWAIGRVVSPNPPATVYLVR